MLMVLLVLTLVAFCVVLALDVGRLYFERRNLQRQVDLFALEIVASEDLYNGSVTAGRLQTLAAEAINRYGLKSAEAEMVNIRESATAPDDAVRVEFVRTVPNSIVPNLAAIFPGIDVSPEIDIRVEAVAARPLYVAISAGTNLLTADVNSSLLLKELVVRLLGSGVNLSLLGYKGLLDTHITLLQIADFLPLGLDLSAITADQLLETQLTTIDIVNASISALTGGDKGNELLALQNFQNNASWALKNQPIRLGDILSINNELKGTEALGALVSIGDLLNASVFAANKASGVNLQNIGLDIGIAKILLGLSIIESPRVAVGLPGCRDGSTGNCGSSSENWYTAAEPAQLGLNAEVAVSIPLVLTLGVELEVSAASGLAGVSTVNRSNNAACDYQAVVYGETAALSADVSLVLRLLGFLSLPQNKQDSLNQSIYAKKLDLFWSGDSSASCGPVSETISLGSGGVSNLISTSINGFPVLGTLGVLNTVLSAVLSPLSPVLEALGLDANAMDVRLLGVQTGTAELVL